MVGFDAKNKDSIDPLYLCNICHLIFRDPQQLNCGHRFCLSCVDDINQTNIRCLECSEETPRTEIMPDRGFRNDMKKLLIQCDLCGWIDEFKDYENHLVQDHNNPVCSYCSERFPSAQALEIHKQRDCLKITVPCALKEYGCTDQVIRVELAAHYQSIIHQNSIINFVRRYGSKANLEQQGQHSGMDVDSVQHPYTQTAASAATTSNEIIIGQMQDAYETINVLAAGVQALNDDTQRLSTESIRVNNMVEALRQEFESLKLSVQEQGAFLEGLRPNQDILQQDVSSLKQKMEDLQYVSYDGTLIWKITSFNEKMMDAQSERQTSIYSPPFYSSPTGYKMRARLYLHGDGNARRTHISLFFVLMRGPNDAILKFPFNYKVTFCLYDQTPQQRHIIDSFRPDIKSNSFQRPRSDMNIASGIPKFFPLSMIQQEGNSYVKEDTMFIKIMVDFGDMPKTMLPYALSLNPGLPSQIQQTMIKQEIERRAQQATPLVNRPIVADSQSPSPSFNSSPLFNSPNEDSRGQSNQGSHEELE